MTTQHDPIEMKFEEWFGKYKPVANPTGDSFVQVDDVCYAFGLHGADLVKIQAADPNCVWSLIESDDVDYDDDDEDRDTVLIISDGFHRVNVMGYLITEVPADPKSFYEISYD
ncbi:hypothetical protein I7Z51_002439 [Vibrio parahaemolyticus]|uniref:hypothetical protein n=1 Tax=Vibrio TaxID=662 RepID=UPI001A8D7A71|nr:MULTISPECIES: hypothetical protein [Vibrio]EGQ7973517.1 hypothetical protein [Vibrio parahaemolyticus]MBO0208581.1 hypothetical protein [Vibrio sp. Vb0877]MCR9810956.1 hypothetical protein [Vibrio parahaemolyticus]MDW2323215.1 hypothetical protein [Vibrio sp. 1159]